jgi:hypothetical protein
MIEPFFNQMDIDELLNPEPEHEIIAMNVSDEEIFKSVHEHRQGEEMMEINGRDDTNEEIIKHAKPSRCSSSITHPATVCSSSQ